MKLTISSFALIGIIGLTGCTFKDPGPGPSISQRTLQSGSEPSEISSDIPDKRSFPIQPAVKPCDNFYEHACSVAVRRFQLRPDRSRHIFSMGDAYERILVQKGKFLAALKDRTDLSARTQQLKDNYLACLDAPARADEEKKSLAAIRTALAAIGDRTDLLKFFSDRVAEGDFGFVSLESAANLLNPTAWDFLVSPDLWSLPTPEYYHDEALMADFEGLVKAFFVSIGEPDPALVAHSVVAFEKSVLKGFLKPEEAKKRYSETEHYISKADWLVANSKLGMDSVFAKIPDAVQGRNIYSEGLKELNTVFEQAPVATLKNVYLFRAFAKQLMDGFPAYYQKKHAFDAQYLGGAPAVPPRAEFCTQTVAKRFDKELDAELTEVLFPDFPRARFEQLVERIRQAILRRLEANTWLTPEGKEGALKKMRKARMQLVRPTNEAEWNFVPVAEYGSKTPLLNAKIRLQKRAEQLFARFSQARDWRVWNMGPLDVNAYYSPSDNKFVMLQGILQHPFFDATLSDTEVLGGIGVVVGHELGHGFDNGGSRYNEEGAVAPWMPQKDLEHFREKTNILVAQFNGLVKPEIKKNYGEHTLSENIADTSGLLFAYEAAFADGKGSVDDKQTFYLQYARTWCGTMRETEMVRRIRSDRHAQTVLRVNEPLKHQPGFQEAFACKAGDAMFLPPEKQMGLW